MGLTFLRGVGEKERFSSLTAIEALSAAGAALKLSFLFAFLLVA